MTNTEHGPARATPAQAIETDDGNNSRQPAAWAISYRQDSITKTNNTQMKKSRLAVAVAATAVCGLAMAQAPAFPGAEGFGRYTTGGRGGKVVHVTNLNDSGEGSLRDAVSGNDKKIVVFDVGGVIELTRNLSIGGNTTILGQTAPGQGITLRYYTVEYGGDNIIVRFVRFRRGQEVDVNDGADATWTRQHHNIILDHCSFSWSIDEVASFYDNRDFTMQWCTVAEALNNAGHNKGAHGYGGIWGGKGASFHHNFLAHLNNRSPRFNGSRYAWNGYDESKYANTVMAERVDFRNCLIYNWGTGGCYGGPGGGFINMVNNYYKAGPGTKHKNRVTECSTASEGNSEGAPDELIGMKSRYYINGNYVEGYGANYDWKGVTYDDGRQTFTDKAGLYGEGEGATISVRLDEPSETGTVTTHSAETAYEKVRLYAGASLSRDLQDTRYAEEALNGTATYMGSITKLAGMLDLVEDQGGYSIERATRPEAYDEDNDGIPDTWERANGLDPNNPNDATATTLDPARYYTNIEVYANSLVQDIMLAGNADALIPVEEYYPQYTKTDGTVVEAINVPEDLPAQPDDLEDLATGSITWTLTSGNIEEATLSDGISDLVASTSMSIGSNLTTDGTRSINGTTMTQLKTAEKQSTAMSSNQIRFTVTPANGIYFTPTCAKVMLSRIGTNSGVFDLAWQDKNSETTIVTGGEINRNNAESGWYTDLTQTITDVTATTDECAMLLYIYNVNADKETAIANVVIEGKFAKLADGIHNATTAAPASVTYYNLQGIQATSPGKGVYIMVTKYSDGRQSVRKVTRK